MFGDVVFNWFPLCKIAVVSMDTVLIKIPLNAINNPESPPFDVRRYCIKWPIKLTPFFGHLMLSSLYPAQLSVP